MSMLEGEEGVRADDDYAKGKCTDQSGVRLQRPDPKGGRLFPPFCGRADRETQGRFRGPRACICFDEGHASDIYIVVIQSFSVTIIVFRYSSPPRRPSAISPARYLSCHDRQQSLIAFDLFVRNRCRGCGVGVSLLRYPRPGLRGTMRRVRQMVLQFMRQRFG